MRLVPRPPAPYNYPLITPKGASYAAVILSSVQRPLKEPALAEPMHQTTQRHPVQVNNKTMMPAVFPMTGPQATYLALTQKNGNVSPV